MRNSSQFGEGQPFYRYESAVVRQYFAGGSLFSIYLPRSLGYDFFFPVRN